MAKTASRRHHAARIYSKWSNLASHLEHLNYLKEKLSVGKVYSQDPLDCGRPQCPYCHYSKSNRPKEHRILQKAIVRQELNNLYTSNQQND